ncbi:MAG: AraC family transcriptional regulator, partial [Planctomycetes bacterium]|nr:AraC family transcriptional regulator [Planctomycetota bacterium]
GQVHRMVPGRAFVVMSPEQTRYWRLPGQDWHFIYVLYGGELALEQTRRLLEEGGRMPEFTPSSAAAQALADLYEMGGGADAYAASAILYKLLLTLRGDLYARRSDAGNMPQSIVRALRLAREKYADASFGAAELADACGYSRYHFARLFRRYCGDSPQNYLISLRLGRAMERLATGAESGAVKQIAQDCGFRDYSYFCLMFRKRYGVSPGTLRRSS